MIGTVEVKSNMAGYIEHIRNGVMFQDAGTVLDELVQNAQRSHAKSVHIQVAGDTITVSDDGDGCPDPQLLFESNTSGWADKPEAFGEGFFSVFYLGDEVNVRSHRWSVELDVRDMLDSGNMSVDRVKRDLTFAVGFSISITGERVQTNCRDLIKRAQSLGEMCSPDVYVNGDLVEKVDLLELDGNHAILISNDVFDAAMQPTRWPSNDVYYEGRKVCTHYLYDVKSNIVLKEGGVTLKAPDRKSIVHDGKYDKMEDLLEKGAKSVYKALISKATDKDLDNYSSGIDKWLSVEEYAPLLPVSGSVLYKSEDEGGWMDLSGIGTALADALREATRGNSLKKDALKNVIDATGGRVVYVESYDAERMQSEISQARYEGIAVLYSPNSLYKKAYKHYGVQSLREFLKSSTKVPVIVDPSPKDRREERFLFLMRRVEDRFGLDPGTIRIAEVGMDLVDSRGKVVDSKRESIRGMYVPKDKAIYMDRDSMALSQFSPSDPADPELSVEDRRMLMAEQYVLCHELCHMIYATSDASPDHDTLMADVNREFAGIF